MSRVMYGWRWSNGEWYDGPEPREQEQPATIEQKPRRCRTRTCFTQPPMPPGEVKLRADATRNWLFVLLHSGPKPSKEVFRRAKEWGLSARGVWRAKYHHKVKCYRRGGRQHGYGAVWYWELPAKAEP